jgi:collagenase-like PrtC family protease
MAMMGEPPTGEMGTDETRRVPGPVLVLGPVLFHWPAEALRDFYFRIADEGDFDAVNVGEVVCSKRVPFFADMLPAVIDRLQSAGKEVVLSSLALVGDERDAAAMRALADTASRRGMLVEVNDVSLLGELDGRPHAIGPFINVYNEATLGFLVAHGAVRASLNPELPGSLIADLARLATVPLEVMVFGRVPLAISARCFHARAEDRTKDACQFACADDPDGRLISTMEGAPFLAMNGLQTLSHGCLNLMAELAPLLVAGVRRFRLSPQSGDMVAIARLFRDVLEGRLEAPAAVERLARLTPALPFANGFYHSLPGHQFAIGAP